MFSNRLIQNVLLGFVIVLLVAALSWAYLAGSRAGQRQVVTKNASALASGLSYFYGDQNRFPSTQEFADANLMRNYFSHFPPINIVGGSCSQTFRYSSASSNSFELSYCLPGSAPGKVTSQN